MGTDHFCQPKYQECIGYVSHLAVLKAFTAQNHIDQISQSNGRIHLKNQPLPTLLISRWN